MLGQRRVLRSGMEVQLGHLYQSVSLHCILHIVLSREDLLSGPLKDLNASIESCHEKE